MLPDALAAEITCVDDPRLGFARRAAAVREKAVGVRRSQKLIGEGQRILADPSVRVVLPEPIVDRILAEARVGRERGEKIVTKEAQRLLPRLVDLLCLSQLVPIFGLSLRHALVSSLGLPLGCKGTHPYPYNRQTCQSGASTEP
jgi:hypothetical protein